MSVHGHRSKKTLVRLGMEVGLCERGVLEVMGAGMSGMVLGANMNSLAPGTQAEGRLPAGSTDTPTGSRRSLAAPLSVSWQVL